jgi:hypothetical protein
VIVNITITTLGRSIFRRESGLSYNALGPFHLPVEAMLLSSSMMLCMSLVGPRAKSFWMICMAFSYQVSNLACWTATLLTCEMQRSGGSNLTTWGQVHIEGRLMPWLLTGRVSLCSEEIQKAHGRMRFPVFMFLTQVCTFLWSFHPDSLRDWEHRTHQVPGTRA